MIQEVQAKSILNKSKHPSVWFGMEYGMNIYRGCQYQCIYCDSRSECYRIEDFDNIIVKVNAPELLQKELARKRKRGTIGTGAMSDSYMPLEKEYNLTGKCLEIISYYRYPVIICTKSNLILRDIELLQKIDEVYVCIAFTITTTDDELAKKIEPHAPLPSERLKAMGILSSLGINTGVLMMPLLPFIEDNEENIENIVKKSAYYGASFIIPSFGMTLRDRQRLYYYNKLDEHFPGLREKYEKRFKNRYFCGINSYTKLNNLFNQSCKHHNIYTKMPSYHQKVACMQMSLFNDIK